MRLDRWWLLFIVPLALAGCSSANDPAQILQPVVQPGAPGTPGASDADRNDGDDVKALGDTFAGKIRSISGSGTLGVGDLKIRTNDATHIGNQSGDVFSVSGLTVGNAVVLEIHVADDDADKIVATKVTQVQNARDLPPVVIQGRVSKVSDEDKTFEISGALYHVNNTSSFGRGFADFGDLKTGQVVRVRGKLRPNGDLTMRHIDLVRGDDDVQLAGWQNRPH